MFLPGAPISGHVCCWVDHPLLEKEVTAFPSCTNAATEIAEGVFAYMLVLRSFSDSPTTTTVGSCENYGYIIVIGQHIGQYRNCIRGIIIAVSTPRIRHYSDVELV